VTEKHILSRSQERRAAGLVGGQVVARSGAGWKRKADVRTLTHLLEMKRTDNRKSISIKADDLEKIRRQAASIGKLPALGFELAGRDYVILPMSDFVEMTNED
jgi:Holliday junction resolvase